MQEGRGIVGSLWRSQKSHEENWMGFSWLLLHSRTHLCSSFTDTVMCSPWPNT